MSRATERTVASIGSSIATSAFVRMTIGSAPLLAAITRSRSSRPAGSGPGHHRLPRLPLLRRLRTRPKPDDVAEREPDNEPNGKPKCEPYDDAKHESNNESECLSE